MWVRGAFGGGGASARGFKVGFQALRATYEVLLGAAGGFGAGLSSTMNFFIVAAILL